MVKILFVSVLLWCSPLLAAEFQRRHMEIGESFEVTLANDRGLNVSRRGHIDLLYIGDKKWRISALKRGVVMISPSDSSTEDFRLLIEIGPPPSPSSSTQASKSITANYPWQLELDVELRSAKTTAKFGLSPNLKGDLDFASASQSQSQTMLAKPRAEILPFKPLHLASGGEFQTQYQTGERDENLEGWKSFGLDVDLEITKLLSQKVEIRYDIQMSSAANHEGQLVRHQLRSQSQLSPDARTLVGILDVRSQDQGLKGFAYWERIPIIGPLFRLHSHLDSQNQIWIWLRLKPKSAP